MPVVDVLPLSGTLILDKNKLRTLPPFVCTVFKGSGGIGTYSRVNCFCDMARFLGTIIRPFVLEIFVQHQIFVPAKFNWNFYGIIKMKILHT